VAELGQLDALVGRSHECDYPAGVLPLPVCTRPRIDVTADSREIDRAVKESARAAVSIYDVLDEVIDRLKPTHILTQIQCDVCAVSLRDVELALGRGMRSHPLVVSLQPDSLDQIWQDIRRVADALGVSARGDALVKRLQEEMAALSAVHGTTAPTVACIEWIDPLMAAGNWTPELIRLAGGTNLFGMAGAHSPWLSWEELVEADPDVIVIAPCGFDLARTVQEMHWLTERPAWRRLRAVRENRVVLGDGNQYFNRPGPRVVETLAILTEMLFGRTHHFEGRGWMHWSPESAAIPATVP
jgi:iron complex transport system substrate-binding protein